MGPLNPLSLADLFSQALVATYATWICVFYYHIFKQKLYEFKCPIQVSQ